MAAEPFNLKANFEADLITHVKKHLTNQWGMEVSNIDDKKILIHFFDSHRRRITARPRAIRIADDFNCPPPQQQGWEALQAKIMNGDDLGPHLSTGHASLFNNDGLLNEWGVHHFHLGINPHAYKLSYVERSGPVVFALVDGSTFFAVNVYVHGAWEEISVVESLHRNWPDVISKYRLRGIHGEALAKKERQVLRRKNGNVAVNMQDGTVYGPIGGPVSCAGTKVDSVMHADRWSDEIKRLQAGFETDLGQVMPTLKQAGYAEEQDIEAKLKISDAGDYQVFFPQYGVLVSLHVTGMLYMFKTLV